MRRRLIFALLVTFPLGSAGAYPSTQGHPDRVVDRIVARIEDDIILLSQIRELGAFQKLVEGHAEGDDRLLAELIEQWMVRTEATAAYFPQPAQSEVDREMARLQSQFASPEAYARRLRELELSDSEARELLTRQIYIERYLDYKFRPTVQIEASDTEAYYQKELLPELARKNQPAPPLPEVEGQIREVLTQRGISDRTAKWLDDTKSRLKIEVSLPGAAP
jgi:parvulin-like peptidyl-prolyl isomerase